MFRQVVSPLVMPAPVVAGAQFDQYGQMLDTATVCTALPMDMDIVAPLCPHGNIR